MVTIRPPVRVLAAVSVAFPALVVPPAVGLLTGVVLRAAAPAAAVPIPIATTVVVVVVRSTITVALRLALPIPVPIPASIAVRCHVPLSECSSAFTGSWTGTPLQDGQTTHLSLLSATLSALWLVVGMPAGVAISPPVGPAYIGVQVQVQDHRRRRV